jgi:copper chaperone CopZ
MKKLIIILTILTAITMSLTLTACGDGNDAQQAPATSATSETPGTSAENAVTTEQEPAATTELTVWGMTCTRCENKIINALTEIEGVIDVSADSGNDKVTVIHDPELDIDTINSVITGEGFNIP